MWGKLARDHIHIHYQDQHKTVVQKEADITAIN